MRRLAVYPDTWVPRSDDFEPFYAPGCIRYCAAHYGAVLAPADSEYAYCELGAGAGAHIVGLGCLMPDIAVWGVESNPSAAMRAGRLMRVCKASNVTLAPLSLQRFLEAQTPAFDCIVLREGVSALSATDRKLLIAIAARKLKCGGALVLSYEALPAAAPFQALIALLRELWFHAAGNEAERLESALNTLKAMLETEQGLFFPNRSMAAGLCQSLLKMDRRDVLHRYLTPEYEPVWFHELAAALAEHGVLFRGSLDFHARFASFGVSESAEALINGATVPELQEMIRDCLAGTPWRRDIFTRGRGEDFGDAARILAATPFSVSMREGAYAEALATPRGEMRLDMSRHIPALERAARDGLASPEQLCRKLSAEPPYSLEEVADICAVRLATGDMIPGVEHPDEARIRACNSELLRRSVSYNAMASLVSPLGGCARLNPIAALFCIGLENGNEPLSFAAQTIEEQLKAAGQADDPVHREQVLLRQFEHFSGVILPELRRMRILPDKEHDHDPV